MSRVIRRPLALGLLAFVLALAGPACATSSESDEPGPLQIGSLGPVLPEAADEAVLGLCDVWVASDRADAAATFEDHSHEILHVVAAAVQEVDRGAAADLLEAKQVVEADLAEPVLPDDFEGDVETLLGALRASLGAIGLDAPDCPA
jgi:hypothetical protein